MMARHRSKRSLRAISAFGWFVITVFLSVVAGFASVWFVYTGDLIRLMVSLFVMAVLALLAACTVKYWW